MAPSSAEKLPFLRRLSNGIPGHFRGYAAALLLVITAVLISDVLLHTVGARFPLIYQYVFLLALMAASWLGYGPGLLAYVTAISLGRVLFSRPLIVNPGRMLLATLLCLLISTFSWSRRRMEAALRKANDELDERVRQRTAELAESEKRFRTLADAAPALIWTATPNKLCDYVNKPWLDFTGHSLEQELGDGWTEAIHPEDRECCVDTYAKAFDKRVPFSVEYRLRRFDGKYRWMLDHGVPRFSAEGEFAGYIGSCFDITERKEANERIQEAAKLESLGILAGGIAHDFNNLLVGILGNSSLACDILPPTHPARPIIDDVMHASEKAAELTRQMLAYAGKGRFLSKSIDLSELVREIGHLVQVSTPKNVHLRFELASGLPPIDGDPSQLQQVIMNLVINGAEACDPNLGGSVILATFMQPVDEEYRRTVFAGEPLKPGNYVGLEVQDTGCGMDEQTKAKIFDPFFTTKFTGRGLGLSAVLGIVRGHKGAIKVYSTPGKGTAFKVLFPAAPAGQTVAVEEMAAAPAYQHSGTILVVDDEEIVRKAANSALKRLGYTVILAGGGEEALEKFRSAGGEIALVLLDLTMPTMSGEETFRRLRAIQPDVRVVVSSGYNEVEAVRHFTTKGIAGFLQKPYTTAQLAEKLKSILEPGAAAVS